MRSSSHFKATIGISLLAILIIGLTFLDSMRVTIRAAATSLKLSTKSGEAAATPPATCGASDLRSLERHSQLNLYLE